LECGQTHALILLIPKTEVKYEVEDENLGGKKEQGKLVMVHVEVQSGQVEGLRLVHGTNVTTTNKSIQKCDVKLFW
jgi:hypothetical protein